MRFYFEEEKNWSEYKQDVADRINGIGAPCVIFGKSITSSSAFLDMLQVPLKHICSNTPASWGKHFWGLEIISPSKVQELYQNYTILILADDTDDVISKQIQRFSPRPLDVFKLDLHQESGCGAYFKEMQPVINTIYDRLCDQKSKDTYEALLRYRINRTINFLPRFAVAAEPEYFPDSLGAHIPFLGPNEVFVDAGAYTGDTVRKFLSAVHGKYQFIYAFEPDLGNYNKLLENTKDLANIRAFNSGLGEKTERVQFSSRDTSSKVDLAGEQTVQIESLDHVLAGAPITYLKMDIEGMECPALRGAKDLIQAYRPKLAICSYHSNQDMVEVPRMILDLNPDYQLFLRHYSSTLCETVCYAI